MLLFNNYFISIAVTHRTLKCDVTVDRVTRLDITTRTREIHTFDALELLEVCFVLYIFLKFLIFVFYLFNDLL